MKISVIIPTWNEERRIGRRLDELRAMRGIHEVIVADGGSVDATRDIVRDSRWARLLEAPRSRARQMNAGADAATGDAVVFLHADCQLPSDACDWIERTLSRPGVVAGAFKTWTVADMDDRRAYWLHLADLRSRYTKVPYGDQAIFVRADVFHRVGGYPDIALMEDIALSRRLRAQGRLVTVPARVRVSGRRFLAHPIRDTLLVNVFPLLYRLGASPETLKSLYDDIR